MIKFILKERFSFLDLVTITMSASAFLHGMFLVAAVIFLSGALIGAILK